MPRSLDRCFLPDQGRGLRVQALNRGAPQDCDWEACTDPGTHNVRITFPAEPVETWTVCRAHDRVLKLQAVRSRPKKPPALDKPTQITVLCVGCGAHLDEQHDLANELRDPCPICGSRERRVEILAFETITGHDAAVLQKEPGESKGIWMAEIKTGDNCTRDLDAWGQRSFTRDRAKDLYQEIIELWDGTRVESRARLTDHHD